MMYLVMIQMDQQLYCKDVSVMRRANCWTDHRLVRAKLSLRCQIHILAVLAVGLSLFINWHQL